MKAEPRLLFAMADYRFGQDVEQFTCVARESANGNITLAGRAVLAF
jgi:hypothetical protein